MKYSFILEIDDISKDDINELVNILSDNKIKFHVLKSDKELKENQKYKEVISKAIKHVSSLSSRGRDCMIYADVKKDILDILKEVD